MSRIARRPLPPIPGTATFPELNVRTYVTRADRPGVWFFSLDAANRLAVWAARRWFHLNYVHARMAVGRDGPRVHYAAARRDGVAFAASYEPVGPVARPPAGSLAHRLTERYCLYAGSARALFRADIHHAPWPLQPARVALRRNDLPAANGIPVAGPPPLVHYAERLDVVVWAAARVLDA